jgi:hypothetical protein
MLYDLYCYQKLRPLNVVSVCLEQQRAVWLCKIKNYELVMGNVMT